MIFAPQRTFGDVQKHFLLSQLGGRGRDYSTDIKWVETKDATKDSASTKKFPTQNLNSSRDESPWEIKQYYQLRLEFSSSGMGICPLRRIWGQLELSLQPNSTCSFQLFPVWLKARLFMKKEKLVQNRNGIKAQASHNIWVQFLARVFYLKSWNILQDFVNDVLWVFLYKTMDWNETEQVL